MRLAVLLTIASCVTCILCEDNGNSPRIIIVGAGSAGIGAASRLFENGFNNVTVLEAENRIGGRVYSRQFGDYIVDMGGQWVHGEKGSVSFDLAWPLGIIERFGDEFNYTVAIFKSTGEKIPDDVAQQLVVHFKTMTEDPPPDNIEQYKNGSIGEYWVAEMRKYFAAHPEIKAEYHEPLLHLLNMMVMGLEGADTWFDMPIKTAVPWTEAEGDQAINWKERAYGTILDILMKKFPNPEEELPVLNNTILGNKVTKITYNENAPAKVMTADGREYTADHVIFTGSLGVLKAYHDKLFDPPLPEKKINSINNIGFGHEAKILLYYENPWWPMEDDIYTKAIMWTEEEKKELEADPETEWMLGLCYFFRVEHKPKLLIAWLSSKYSTLMERVSDEKYRAQTLEIINKFYGRHYNITEPKEIIRSTWNTNDNFLGTYTYRTLQSDPAKASHEHIAEPIIQNGKPILQFAGETTEKHWGTVHGAISSGQREADRLIDIYAKKGAIQ